MGKGNAVVQEEKTSSKMCILVPSTDMSSWESVAAVSCSCLINDIPQRIIGQARFILKILLDKIINQDIIVHWYYWTRLLITSFTGCTSFLKSLCVHGHILFLSSFMIVCLVTWNYYPPVTTCSSMVFVLGHIWNNGCHQQHFIIRKKIVGQVHHLLHLMLLLHRRLHSSSPTTTSSTSTSIRL